MRFIAAALLLLVSCQGEHAPAMKKGSTQCDITFPPGWSETAPNRSFTVRKAIAKEPPYAAVSVASRDSLWADDVTSSSFEDAWVAFDKISERTFREKFERNDPTANEYPEILEVRKERLGEYPALFVDYVLSRKSEQKAVRIRSFFVLRGHVWWSVSAATSAQTPDAHLPEMLAAAKTFRLR